MWAEHNQYIMNSKLAIYTAKWLRISGPAALVLLAKKMMLVSLELSKKTLLCCKELFFVSTTVWTRRFYNSKKNQRFVNGIIAELVMVRFRKRRKLQISLPVVLIPIHNADPNSDRVEKTSPQCSGFMTFWDGSGSGSGSSDPCFWQMDPDPAIFVIDLQEASKKII